MVPVRSNGCAALLWYADGHFAVLWSGAIMGSCPPPELAHIDDIHYYATEPSTVVQE